MGMVGLGVLWPLLPGGGQTWLRPRVRIGAELSGRRASGFSGSGLGEASVMVPVFFLDFSEVKEARAFPRSESQGFWAPGEVEDGWFIGLVLLFFGAGGALCLESKGGLFDWLRVLFLGKLWVVILVLEATYRRMKSIPRVRSQLRPQTTCQGWSRARSLL
jgi:hypothetical protein